MPALWESSQRPMFIRTVWVDGYRHAVLTEDDPLLKRSRRPRPRRPATGLPYSATRDPTNLARFKSRPSQQAEQLQDCFQQLRLLRTEETPQENTAPDSPVEEINLDDVGSISDEELVLKAYAHPINELESSRSKLAGLSIEMPLVKRNAPKEPEEKFDLSDRVIHWLDLAGKIDLLSPEAESERIVQQRHSCPEIEKRISQKFYAKMAQERASKPKPKLEVGNACRTAVDIDPPCHATDSQSRQRGENKHLESEQSERMSSDQSGRRRTKEPVKVKSPMGMKTHNINLSISETRRRATEEMQAVERQFAELMSRGVNSETGVRHIKRQVHIFMPPMPKKPGPVANARVESVLSQV